MHGRHHGQAAQLIGNLREDIARAAKNATEVAIWLESETEPKPTAEELFAIGWHLAGMTTTVEMAVKTIADRFDDLLEPGWKLQLQRPQSPLYAPPSEILKAASERFQDLDSFLNGLYQRLRRLALEQLGTIQLSDEEIEEAINRWSEEA